MSRTIVGDAGSEPQVLRLVLVEDNPRDVELALLTLERAGYKLQVHVVQDRPALEQALKGGGVDLIISDYVLPSFSGALALRMARELLPHVPFIFFSGVFGEAHAVEMMRLGAQDYVLKQNLSSLPQVVARVLEEALSLSFPASRLAERADVAELRASLAIEAARLGVWDLDLQTGHLNLDGRCRHLLDVGERTDDSLDVFISAAHIDDRPRLEQAFHWALSAPKTTHFFEEYRVVLRGGRLRWVALRGRTVLCAGKCTRFIGVLMDVTSERLATQALKQQNLVLGERVQARTRERDRTWALSRDVLMVADFNLRAHEVNPAWQDVLGWSEEQVRSMNSLLEVVHPDDYGATRQAIEALGSGAVITSFLNRARHANGSYRWISWSAVPDGERIYASGRDVSRDMLVLDELATANLKLTEQIEERERVEATLRQMQRLEAVGQLTAGVAHDFNNLLVVILSSTSLLERELDSLNLPRRVRQRLSNIREAGERGARLTTQLLAFARRQNLEPRVLNLNQAVSGMLGLLQTTLGGGIRVQTGFVHPLWPTRVDPTQLELIVLNLAINARDAMHGAGTLQLATYNCTITEPAARAEEPEPGEYVVLTVRDDGEGMTPEVLAKAFEPFFTTKEVGKGSGLGLAQVFGFAKQTGGGVTISTCKGEGTSVSVYFPRHADSAGSIAPAETVASTALPQRVVNPTECTVLLVDDDDAVREVTAILLEDQGCTVVQAVSAARALDLLAAGVRVDVLLTDFAMPGMNGAQLARQVRASHPRLPVIFITGYAELEGLDTEGVPILQKPFNEAELIARIRHAISGSGRE